MARKKTQTTNWILIAVVLALIGGGIWYAANNIALQSETAGFTDQETTIAETPDYYRFDVYLTSGTQISSFNVTEYRADISDLTDDEIADLTFSDFSAQPVQSATNDTKFDIKSDYAQIFKISGSDISYQWVLPSAGDNLIYVVNQSAGMALITSEKDGGSTTIVNTTDDEWVLFMKATDVNTTDNIPQGWDSGRWDFEHSTPSTAIYDYVVVNVTYNTTAEYSFASCDDAVDEIVSQSSTIFYLPGDLMSDSWAEIELDFGSGLNSAFNVSSVSIGYGNVETGITAYA